MWGEGKNLATSKYTKFYKKGIKKIQNKLMETTFFRKNTNNFDIDFFVVYFGKCLGAAHFKFW